jgi:hypothetical protein
MPACHRLLLRPLVGLVLGATIMARPDPACADSIFVPGSTRVAATFGGEVSRVQGDIPAIPLGTFVSGRFVYDLGVIDPSNGTYPIVDLLISAGPVTFTQADILESRVREFPGTFGFDAQVLLRGQPGLGDLGDEIFFEEYAALEASHGADPVTRQGED